MKYLTASFAFLTVYLTILAAPVKPEEFRKYFRLMPEPQKIEMLPGKSLVPADIKFIHLDGPKRRPVLKETLDRLPLSSSSGKGILTLSLRQDNDLPESQ